MLSKCSRRTTEIILVTLLAAAITACGSTPPAEPVAVTKGERLLREARAAYGADRYQQALLRYTDAAEHFRSLDDNRNLALALISEAEILLLYGESRLALGPMGALDDALDVIGNPPDLLARQQLLQARFKASLSHGSEAARKELAGLLERDDMIGEAARILDCREQLRLGIDNGRCSDEIIARSALGKARVARLRADAASMQGELARALELNSQALSAYRAAPYRPGIAASLEERAALLLQHEMPEQDESARDILIRALHIRTWLRDRVHAHRDVEQLLEIEPSGGWTALARELSKDEPSWPIVRDMLDTLR